MKSVNDVSEQVSTLSPVQIVPPRGRGRRGSEFGRVRPCHGSVTYHRHHRAEQNGGSVMAPIRSIAAVLLIPPAFIGLPASGDAATVGSLRFIGVATVPNDEEVD